MKFILCILDSGYENIPNSAFIFLEIMSLLSGLSESVSISGNYLASIKTSYFSFQLIFSFNRNRHTGKM
jgi:hypothetical protein